MKVTLSKSFSTRTERSERVIKVAEAFGLGLEDREFTVLRELELEISRDDVIYVHGQSGSGKSTLLRELASALSKELSVKRIEDVEMREVPLIDQIGDDMADAIRLLSIAGLSDAYLYIRKPSELSDGQRYRFAVAKLIESDADVWVADEFGAVLDRVCARCLAYNTQKLARQLGKCLLVATTHGDLVDELAPSLAITKRFNDRITIDDRRAA